MKGKYVGTLKVSWKSFAPFLRRFPSASLGVLGKGICSLGKLKVWGCLKGFQERRFRSFGEEI
jgi:hypothetical protein